MPSPLNYRLQPQRMLRYVPWEGDRALYLRMSQDYQAEVLKHATELFRRRKYSPTGGTFAFMLNDPAPAISWSVVDWRRRPKAAFEVLKTAMAPVLVCAEYPEESYEAGAALSLPLFVVNDLARDLGEVSWSWELLLGESTMARGEGETEIAARFGGEDRGSQGRAPCSGRRPCSCCVYRGGRRRRRNRYGFRISESGRRGPSARGG